MDANQTVQIDEGDRVMGLIAMLLGDQTGEKYEYEEINKQSEETA